jgi:hypothetical protein
MLELGRRSIVNISSFGGLNAFRAHTSYNVSESRGHEITTY